MTIQITGTWALANVLHPFFLFLPYADLSFFTIEAFGMLIYFMLLSFFFSIPSLLLSLFAGHLAAHSTFKANTLFITWFFLAPLFSFANAALILSSFGSGSFSLEEFTLIGPCVFAAIVSVLLRYRSFIKSFEQIKTGNNETTVV